MGFRVQAPRLTPDIAAAEIEQKKAPWGTRIEALKEDIIDARMYMLVRYPFWGRLAMKMDLMFTDTIDTACVRPDMLTFFNPEFYEALPPKGKTFVIAHELCHLAYLHFDRIEDRDPGRWNRAGDYMINSMLVESGMEMLTDENGKKIGLYEERFKSMSDVEIYDILEKEDREQGRDGYGRKQSGDGKEPPKMKTGFGEEGGDCDFGATQTLKEQSEAGTGRHVMTPAEMRNELVAAVAAAKQRGDCPAGMDRWATELSEPLLSWEELLKQYIDDRFKRHLTYASLSRRTASYNAALKKSGMNSKGTAIPLPAPKPWLAPVVIAFDSSGSVSADELSEMASETSDILSQYDVPQRFICADAAVHVDIYIDSAEDIIFKGGGGTSHVPVFDRINGTDGYVSEVDHREPKLVVCFTDLYTEFPAEKPDYDVIWVNIGQGNAPEPPWGTLINRNPEKRQFLRSNNLLPAPSAALPVVSAVEVPVPVKAGGMKM